MTFDIFNILEKLQFQPKKNLGQNFLNSKGLLDKILSISELTKDDTILEIGAGLGFLTKPLADNAKKVYAVEIEPKFCQFLSEELRSYDNISIINEDILKMDIPECSKVVSNIPFSISGPILEKVFFNAKPPQGIITIERKLADRIFSEGGYKDFSRITVSINSFMDPVAHHKYPRNVFKPVPKIDVSLIKLLPKKAIHPFLKEKETRDFFLKFLGGIMPYKNKNIANAIKFFYKKEFNLDISTKQLIHFLQDNNYQNVKLSNLDINEFPNLCRDFYNSKYID